MSDLRRIVRVVAGVVALSACQSVRLPENMPSDPRDLIRQRPGTGERAWTTRQRDDARQAQSLFMRAAEPAGGAGSAQRARALLRRYRNKVRLTSAEQDTVISVFSPFLDSPAPGAVREAEIGSYREILVPANSRVALRLSTYCMDLGIPAPRSGERQHLVPVHTLLDPALVPVYQGLMAHSHTHPGNADQIQRIVWNLRDFQSGRQQALSMQQADFSLLNQAYPNADAVLRRYEQRKRVQRWVENRLRSEVQQFLNSRGVDLSRAPASLVEANRQVGRVLDALAAMPIGTPLPTDNSDYSLLQPGVAVRAVHPVDGARSSSIVILNTNASPVAFRPGEYALQSRRNTQRLAVGGVEPISDRGRGLPDDPPIEAVYPVEELILWIYGGGPALKGVGRAGQAAWSAFLYRAGVWKATQKAVPRPSVTNPRLRNTVDQLYRTGDDVPGGTAGALRVERITGRPVGGTMHRTKATERISNLENLLRREQLNPADRATAQRLIRDLKDALSGN